MINTFLASSARLSAHKPIQAIIITALVTAIAYLSIVDEFIGLGPVDVSEVSYYHAASASSDWTIATDPAKYTAAEHLAIAPLHFPKSKQHSVPVIENTFYTTFSHEKYLICKYSEVPETLANISSVVASDGTVWKLSHQYKVGKYKDYALGAYHRVKALIVGAEPFDIAIVTMAYLAMYYTLFKLFYDMRHQTGSKFWLAFGSVTSSSFAFLLAFATSTILGFKISFLSLSEGIPFLVATVGFDRVVKMSRAVLKSSKKDSISQSIFEVLQPSALNFVKDQLVCAAAFFACAIYAPHLEGLKNFCVLSSLIMIYDVILTFTYFAAVLALKIEINMIHRISAFEAALEEDGVPVQSAKTTASDIYKPASENQFHNDTSSVSMFKLISIVCFIAFHVWLVGSNWVFESDIDTASTAEIVRNMSKSLAKHISIGENGTLVTILEPRVFVPKSLYIQIEDVVFGFLEKISAAITDKLISKTILFLFGTSAAINAYLLNATRTKTFKDVGEQKVKVKEVVVQAPVPVGVSSPGTTVADNKTEVRPLEECVAALNENRLSSLNDNEVASLSINGKLPLYALEKKLGDTTRAVIVRRKAIASLANVPVVDSDNVPYLGYDYDKVFGACCENVIGYIPLPLGIAGPVLIDGKPFHIPMATTEGCLVASTMRGCKAINSGGGVTTILTRDGMTRGPCVKFPSLKRAGACKLWLDSDEGQALLKKDFNSTSRFARLQHVQTAIAGSLLYIRFRTTTGDAMGMNMISKGVEYTLKQITTVHGWSDMEVISVSGNYCADKKSAAVNWINGRGKSIVAEARVPADVVRKVLKSDVDSLVELNISKNLIGSAVAGSLGGFNAHAANLVTAVFLACGQDPAQNVESSNCITLIDNVDGDLVISVSMPSIEVGTIGGGTILGPQAAMLDMLGVRGPNAETPGANAQQLAKIVASAVLAAELSLCSALAAGHLVQSHMTHNRAGGVVVNKGCA